MLPLMLTAVKKGRLTLDDLIQKMHHKPREIFNFPEQPDTYVEVNLDEEWTIPEKTAFSKAGWTPFAGQKVTGKVKRVVLRGKVVYVDGQVLSEPGYGQNVRNWPSQRPKTTRSRVPSMNDPAKFERSRPNSRQDNNVVGILEIPQTNLDLMGLDLLKGQNILEVSMFSKDILYDLFHNAEFFKKAIEKDWSIDHILRGKVMASIFYEPRLVS